MRGFDGEQNQITKCITTFSGNLKGNATHGSARAHSRHIVVPTRPPRRCSSEACLTKLTAYCMMHFGDECNNEASCETDSMLKFTLLIYRRNYRMARSERAGSAPEHAAVNDEWAGICHALAWLWGESSARKTSDLAPGLAMLPLEEACPRQLAVLGLLDLLCLHHFHRWLPCLCLGFAGLLDARVQFRPGRRAERRRRGG